LVSQQKVKDSGKNRARLAKLGNSARQKNLSVILSPSLKGEHGVKALPVRNGDTVVVRRGEWTLQEGKVSRVNTSNKKVFVENIKREGADGKESLIPLCPENLMITKLNLDDKWRKKIIERLGFAPSQ